MGCGRRGQLHQTPLCHAKWPFHLGEGTCPSEPSPGRGLLAGTLEGSVPGMQGRAALGMSVFVVGRGLLWA